MSGQRRTVAVVRVTLSGEASIMTIQLKPETEALIQQNLCSDGPYRTAQEYVEHAISLLHGQETWLSSHKTQIAAQLETGYAASMRDEVADEDQVRANMASKKWIWQQSETVSLHTSSGRGWSKGYSWGNNRTPGTPG